MSGILVQAESQHLSPINRPVLKFLEVADYRELIFLIPMYRKKLGKHFFKSQDDFFEGTSHRTNICGVNWGKANLSQKVFVGYHAGLPFIQVAIKTLSLCILLSFSGVLAALAAIFATGLLNPKNDSFFLGIAVVSLALVGLLITYRRGFSVFFITTIVSFIASAILIFSLRYSAIINSFFYISVTVTSETLALWLCSTAIAAGRTLSKSILIVGSLSALLSAGVTLLLIEHLSPVPVEPNWLDVAIAISILLAASFIGWNAFKPNSKFPGIAQLAINLTAIGGTSFRWANLTDVNFSDASLKHTDFRGANLTRTCWHNTKGLEFARLGSTYLANNQIRQLVVTLNAQTQSFNELDMAGVNLENANLQDTSFVGTNLNHANLRNADLSRAILKQTQIDGADFTGAILTGAYIEDWGITSSTKLEGVRCEYIYMHLPTKEDPDPQRKPDNRKEVFADGEFGDFIKPLVDTLDLYHNQNVDPRAIAISFKELAEKNPDAELEIVGMEKRDQDKFLLRAKTAPEADKSQLSAEYFEIYNHVKALAEKEVKTLIAEKNSRIRSLENFVHTSLQRPNFYSSTQIEKVSNMTSNPGGFSVSGSVEGNINNVQGDNNRAVQGENNQAVLGDGNQVIQQNQVNTEAEALLTRTDILALLAQLENLVQTAEVSQDIKETAIEDISAAKKATDKEEPKKNIALANLESVAQTIEKTSKTVDAGQKLWNKAKPIIVKIAGWLGAAASSYLLKL